MRYGAEIHVNDCMDQVVVQITLLSWDGLGSPPQIIYENTTSTPGYGESMPSQWLSRALREACIA